MMQPNANLVICLGEMLLRLSPPGACHLFQTPALDAHFGGAEANVAVALARLGSPSAIVSCVPDDIIGDAAIEAVRRHGVDTRWIMRGAGRMGLYYLASGAGLRRASVVYDREGSAFCAIAPDAIRWDEILQGASWLHLSGITPALGAQSARLALDAARAARAHGVRVSFDGNYRARLWARWSSDPAAILRELVAEADLLFGNHRDITLLLGRPVSGEGTERRRDAALAAFDAFPSLRWIASTTRRAEDAGRQHLSARVDTREDAHETGEIAMTGIVDRIGGGDAFAAGVLHALERGVEQASVYGLALAVLKHFTAGDVSLSTRVDVAAFLTGDRDVDR